MHSQHMREWAAAGLLAGVLALVGCGSDEDATTSAAATRTPTATATVEAAASFPEEMRGEWKRVMKTKDWGTDGYPLGAWRFKTDGKGGVSVYIPRTSAVDFTTNFKVDGENLVIDSIPVCPGQTGRYAWRASGEKLTLTVVDDGGCKPGAALFGGTWTRRQ